MEILIFNDNLISHINNTKNLKALFLVLFFPNSLENIAKVNKHLTLIV